MKSSLLLTIALTTLLGSSAWAQGTRTRAMRGTKPQTAKPAAKPTTTTSTQAVAPAQAEKKTAFQRFYDRLSINYFGVFTSPTLEDFNSANAAISPDLGDTGRRCNKNCDTYAMNIWSQVNFAYDFGWKMKFNIIPRWTTYFDNPVDMDRSAGEDRATIGLEDFLFGFSGVVLSSEDKKFNWWMRPGVRLPTSHFARSNTNPQFGDLTNNVELLSSFTYDFNAALQVGLNAQQRMWVYEDRYNYSRIRFINAPFVTYALSDKAKWQLHYQWFIENNKRHPDIGARKPDRFFDNYQDMITGVSYDFTERLNIFPYLGVFINDVPLSMRSTYLGAWIAYRIK